MCGDQAIPVHFLLNKSKAAYRQIVSNYAEHAPPEAERPSSPKKEERTDSAGSDRAEIPKPKKEQEPKYTARIPNRYTSINYIQQY